MKQYTPDKICEIIEEFDRTRTGQKQDESHILEAALFVEDEFRLVLTDNEICPENLGTDEGIKYLVLHKLGIG